METGMIYKIERLDCEGRSVVDRTYATGHFSDVQEFYNPSNSPFVNITRIEPVHITPGLADERDRLKEERAQLEARISEIESTGILDQFYGR